jgi:hypothetical protein
MGKTYEISPPPNYPLTAVPSDRLSLTDGVNTTGHFWKSRTTVGWRRSGIIEIVMDLEKVASIEGLVFSTARGRKGDVHFPFHVYVFAGLERTHFGYVGDMAKSVSPPASDYEKRRLKMENLRLLGRYLVLEIVPKGEYVFCDEIEVYGDFEIGIPVSSGSWDLDGVRRHVKERVRGDTEKEILAGLLIKLRKDVAVDSVWDSRFQAVEASLSTNTKRLNGGVLIEGELLALRRDLIRARFTGKDFLIEQIPPWGKYTPVDIPTDSGSISMKFNLLGGGMGADAIRITNLSNVNREYRISLWGSKEKSPTVSVSLVGFVATATLEKIADPLLPVAEPIVLRPGESIIVFIPAKGGTPGLYDFSLAFKSKGGILQIPIKIEVFPAHGLAKRLNAVNWAYLDFKPIRDRKEYSVRDLFEHHINTIVIPPGKIPKIFSEGPAFTEFRKYLEIHKRASKILLFMDYSSESRRSGGKKVAFLEPEWKQGFLSWFRALTREVLQVGFSPGMIYLYPYDEMAGPEINDFISFSNWIRKEVPEARLYGTLGSEESLKAVPWLDIAQVLERPELLRKIGSTKTEIWIYDTRGNAKSLSPYSYYRLMAWKSFLGGYRGIGFWSYADTGWGENPGMAWDDFDGRRPDYAVIYEADNGRLISSRRWEAWRMGVEDYELLSTYANARGMVAAQKLAKKVVDNSENVSLADATRNYILQTLY